MSAPSGGTFTIDDRQWQAYVRKFTPKEIDKLMTRATAIGSRAAAKVIKPQAPIGTSNRPSQFYRANGGGHGSFRASVRAKKIRPRGNNARTIGYVIGPMGKFGFTRAWAEYGTKPHGYRSRPGRHPGAKARPWFGAAASAGEAAATSATQRILDKYAE